MTTDIQIHHVPDGDRHGGSCGVGMSDNTLNVALCAAVLLPLYGAMLIAVTPAIDTSLFGRVTHRLGQALIAGGIIGAAFLAGMAVQS